MIFIEFDKTSNEPLYVQVFNNIANKINRGDIKSGEKLPSQRQLSNQINVSVNTVTNAYNMLVTYGYISSSERSGYYVNNIINAPSMPEKIWYNNVSSIYNFSRNGVDLQFPNQFKKVFKQCAKSFTDFDLTYPDYSGNYDLRKQICSMLNKTQGISCNPIQVIIGPSIEHLIDSLMRVLGQDLIFGLENPAYFRISESMNLSAQNVSYLNVGVSGISKEALSNYSADVLFLMPFHHYPLYYTMSAEQKHTVLEWAGKDRYIIEYGYDMDFVYENQSRPLFTMTENKNVIFAGDFLRSIAPNMNVAYLVLPEHLVNIWQNIYKGYHSAVSPVSQNFICEIIKNGSYYTNINRLRKLYRSKQEYLISCLKDHRSGDKIEFLNNKSGATILIEPRDSVSEEKLIIAAHDKGVKLSYLKYALEQPNPAISLRTFILGFGELSKEDIKKGANLLLDTWTPLFID